MITSELRDNHIEASIFGKLTVEDIHEIERRIEAQIARNEPVALLVDLRAMAGFTLDAIIEDYRFSKRHAADNGKVALLTDSDMDSLLGWFEQSLVSAEIRLFDDEIAARAWLLGEAETTPEIGE